MLLLVSSTLGRVSSSGDISKLHQLKYYFTCDVQANESGGALITRDFQGAKDLVTREKKFREYEFKWRQLNNGTHRQHGLVGLANRASPCKSPVHGPPPSFSPRNAHRAVQSLPPVKLRAHGTEPLADAAYDYIVKSKLILQQSISPGFEQGSTLCWKAMVVDILLWAIDVPPGKADVIIISKVFDRFMADAIHQLHIRNYNIMVTTSFPPKDMTSLRQCVPPLNCKLLRQIFPLCDSLPNTTDVNTPNTHIEETSIASDHHEEDSIRATNSQAQESLSQVTTFYSKMMENCKNLVEELLQEGITEFLECDLYAFYRIRHGEKLKHKEAGFVKLDAFLKAAVPGVNFRSVFVGTKSSILCSSPGHEPATTVPQEKEGSSTISNSVHVLPAPSCRNMLEEMRVRQSILLSDMARPEISTQVLYYGPLTMEEVRNWLHELVECGRADAGINLSLLGKDFEERKGKKLNYKSLHCPTLSVMLSKFEYLVRLERKDSMVILFPRNMQTRNRTRPTMPEFLPVNQPSTQPQRLFCPPVNCTPEVSERPPCTSLQKIVQVPGQINFRKNIPTAVPVPKFSLDLNTTMTAPAAKTVNTVIRPKKSAPSASDVKLEPASEKTREENHLPNANCLPDAGVADSYIECREFLLPKVEQIPTRSSTLAAYEPEYPQIAMASKAAISPRADPVTVAKTASPSTSEIKIELDGVKNHLPNVDAAVPTCGTAKVNVEDASEGTNGDVGNGKKFDFYSLKVVQEREAIKRTFQSVNKRLQEEFKKRKLAHQPSAEATYDRTNK